MTSSLGRLHPKDHFWDGKRKPFAVGVLLVFLLLQLLFLGNLSYLYGVVFESGHKAHNLRILNVNLDGDSSAIQASVSGAYSQLRGKDFFSLVERPASDLPTLHSAREQVCKGHFWAAVVVNNGSSSRLSDALGGGLAADDYNNRDAVTLIYNSAKYPAASLGDIVGNLQTLIGAASAAYGSVRPTSIDSLNTTSLAAVDAFRNPISSSVVDIMPTNHGSRVLYNTVSMVLPIVQQFFFIMALNGLSNSYKLYSSLRIRYAIGMRAAFSTTYTFLSSLGMTGYIWAYREDWGVDANQFAITWMVLWLYMMVNCSVLDTATGFIPMSFVPFFMLTWIILNVSSSIYPLALMPGFYHWGAALPAYNAYNLLVDVWSSGCNPKVHQCLPVLFAWLIVGTSLAIWSMYKRCSTAVKAEEAVEADVQRRIEEAQSASQSASSAEDEEKEVGLRKVNTKATVGETPYPEETKREISRMGIRMPFAETIEGLVGGGSALQRTKTAPGRYSA